MAPVEATCSDTVACAEAALLPGRRDSGALFAWIAWVRPVAAVPAAWAAMVPQPMMSAQSGRPRPSVPALGPPSADPAAAQSGGGAGGVKGSLGRIVTVWTLRGAAPLGPRLGARPSVATVAWLAPLFRRMSRSGPAMSPGQAAAKIQGRSREPGTGPPTGLMSTGFSSRETMRWSLPLAAPIRS